MIVPSKDTIGERLLRRMGWRKGQAVGVRRKFKKPKTDTSASKKVYGVQLPPELLASRGDIEEEEEEEEDAEEEKDFYFSQDTITVEYSHKEDTFGIGYNPYGERGSVKDKQTRQKSTSKMTEPAATSMKFGLGAFEDADDIEVYDTENLEQYDKILGDSAAQNKGTTPRKQESGFSENISNGKCSDGSLPLRGFKVSSRPLSKPKWFPPPTLPTGYKPSSIQQSAAPVSTGMITNPTERGKLLGESPLPSTPTPQKDVFSYIAPQDKEKLLALANRFTSSTEPVEFKSAETIEWESREKNKIFTDTAVKFKPLSVAMSQRFVGGTIIDNTGRELDKSKENKTETYQETAAAMNMFGKLTRATEDWYPAPLLCKRFNLKNPHQGKPVPPSKKEQQQQQQSSGIGVDLLPTGFDAPTSMEYSVPQQPQQEQEQSATTSTVENIQENEEEEEEVIENEERPSIDLFKAIFEDDSTESAENNPIVVDNKSIENTETVPTSTNILVNNPMDALVIPQQQIQQTQSVPVEVNKIEIERKPTNTEEVSRKEVNPYLSYPPKQDSRGGFASEPREIPKPVPVPIEKRRKYDSSDSDSSPHRSKSKHKEKKEKKRKHEKKEKKHKKDKKDKKRRH